MIATERFAVSQCLLVEQSMNPMPSRFRLSVDQYENMIRHGILTERHNVELIRGEIVSKTPKGDFHSYCLRELVRIFGELASQSSTLSIQDPIRLADSEPEPDVVLLVKREHKYRHGKPTLADVLLVIEVADSSLDNDREVKGPLYAENGIAEYWIVNLQERCVEIYRDPKADGTFASVDKRFPGESISPAHLPGITVQIDEFL